MQNFWKCLWSGEEFKGLNLSVIQQVLSYLQDKHPGRILRKFNAKKILIILENLDLKKRNLRGGRAIQVQQRTSLTVFKMFGWEAEHKFTITSPLSMYMIPSTRIYEVWSWNNKKNIFMRVNYCTWSINKIFLNSLKFLHSNQILQRSLRVLLIPHPAEYMMLFWTISVNFFKSCSLGVVQPCFPSTFFLHSLYLVWNSMSADRKMSSSRQEWTISPQLQSHVWAISNFPNIKGRREFAIPILAS